MLGRALRWLQIGWLLLSLAVGWFSGRALWGVLVWLALPLAVGVILAAQFAAVWFVNRGQLAKGLPAVPYARPKLAQLVRAWWAEWRLALMLSRRMGWHQDVVPESVILPAAGVPMRRPVMLVHGFVCNRALWLEWVQTLTSHGHPVLAVDLEPVFGSIDDYLPTIEAGMAKLAAVSPLAPVVIGHSMGGLVIRDWLGFRRQQSAHLPLSVDKTAEQSPNGASPDSTTVAHFPVHHVITLGTPHHGTALARPHLLKYPRNAYQMRPGTPWLPQLASREMAVDWTKFTCFYSHCDNIVFPATTACLNGADNRHAPGVAHIELAFDPLVKQQTLELLDRLA